MAPTPNPWFAFSQDAAGTLKGDRLFYDPISFYLNLFHHLPDSRVVEEKTKEQAWKTG
ncbi:MAG: hypothetical protein MI742_13690 [Desulfobacterales bacterium]|nr:hypothetical protein [Desulfobacterales bacterium]